MFLGRFVLDLSVNASRDLATLTFDLGGHGARRLLLMRVFVLSLFTKFEVRRPSRSGDIAHLLC